MTRPVRDLNDAMARANRFSPAKAATCNNDRVKIVFVLSGDGALQRSPLRRRHVRRPRQGRSDSIAADLMMKRSAGEDAVMMGGVGKAFGKLTDQVAAYRVTAHWSTAGRCGSRGGATVKRMGRSVATIEGFRERVGMTYLSS
jgi:hypothetical protein